MPRYRRKPVELEAFRYGLEAPPKWFDDGAARGVVAAQATSCIIKTLEGDHLANSGDWIIQGVKGELYPCKPDIFELIYEVAQ